MFGRLHKLLAASVKMLVLAVAASRDMVSRVTMPACAAVWRPIRGRDTVGPFPHFAGPTKAVNLRELASVDAAPEEYG